MFRILAWIVFLSACFVFITRSDWLGPEYSDSRKPVGLAEWTDAGITRVKRVYHWLLLPNACEKPLAYRIGDLDERFNLTSAQARRAIERAESVWEEHLDRQLFYYDESASFKIDFVFDERQNQTNAAKTFQTKLDQVASARDGVDANYRELLERHDGLTREYAGKKQAFENSLNAYNSAVAGYNNRGGASTDEFQRLNAEQQRLATEQASLDAMVAQLNRLVDRINDLGDDNNELVDSYNKDVAVFNSRFGGVREFTQGDYQGDRINVYQFRNQDELALVLAHEFGHALQINHVENEESIMFYAMGEQPPKPHLSNEDLLAFNSVCGSNK